MKVGILGLGFMGATHFAAYSKLPGVEIAAVCTRNVAVLANGDSVRIGGNIPDMPAPPDISTIPKHTDWREVLRDPEIELVDICLPSDLHAPIAIEALESGKHVFCEKPMALTATDCDLMIEAAERQERLLMIGHVLRFFPAYTYLEQFVRAGEYGAVRSATFIRRCGLPDWSNWLTEESRSGGATIDLLIHDLDQAQLLFGMPERIAAKKLGDVDALSSTLIYPNGPEVRVQGGWFGPGVPLSMSFQVRAERGELELTPVGLMMTDSMGRRNRIECPEVNGYDAEIAYFVDCCRKRVQPLRCMPADSARAVKLALLLKQSRSMDGAQLKCSV